MAILKSRHDIPSVVQEMTVAEKARLVTGRSPFTTYPIERLGIPAINLLDGATGANFYQLYDDICVRHANDPDHGFGGPVSEAIYKEIRDNLLEPEKLSEQARQVYDNIQYHLQKRLATLQLPGSFPSGILLGASWNDAVCRAVGSAVGREMDAFHVDVVLGPNVNIHRDPRNGRLYEGYSEDPLLVSSLAPSFVQGLQAEGPLANVKHFAANNQETYRQNINEEISLRALQEIYLPGFRACAEGGVKTVMSAYNKINGDACAMNHWLLSEQLRESMRFGGTVISDWGAAYDQAAAIRAGNDLDMPGPRDPQPIVDAVEAGTLAEADLHRAVTKVLEMIVQTPTFTGRARQPSIDRDYSRKAAYDAAAEGIVLLKNDGVLPLCAAHKLSFFGNKSRKFLETGNGSTLVQTDQSTSLIGECSRCAETAFGRVESDTDCVIVTAAAIGQEGSDRGGLTFDRGEREVVLQAIEQAEAAGKPVVLILNVSGPVALDGILERCSAVLCVFLPGMEGARAAADILFGRVNPSGKLPITFPKRIQDAPAYLNFPGTAQRVAYGEGIYVGYRWYEKRQIEPLFPFGFGLSYTEFKIHSPVLSGDTLDLDRDDTLRVSVTVENVGARDGKEVVQLYLADPASTLEKPVKELKAFQKVFVPAGQSVTVSFAISKQMLCSYDEALLEWTAEGGKYEILIGNASNNITARCGFRAVGRSAYSFSERSPIICYLMNDEAAALLRQTIESFGWDFSALNGTLQFYPDHPIGVALTNVYHYDPKHPRWVEFYRTVVDIPVGEFSFDNVAAWTLENIYAG